MKKLQRLNLPIFMGLLIIALIYLLSSIHPTFIMDEEFSMGIIRHTYGNIVNIDSLDVHPPLYYLLLKAFLQITTFWTRSVFIEVLFARIFSFIIFVLSVYFLIKTLIKIGTHVNNKFQILLYMFIPSILSYSTTIRMYSLTALFISAEFYFIVCFNNSRNKKYLFYIILTSSLAAYTHYFAAVSAGLFLFIYFIFYLIRKDLFKAKCYFISGILFSILYIPIIPFVFKQFSYESRGKRNYLNLINELYSSFTGVGESNGILRIIIISLIVILFGFLIYWSFYNNDTNFNFYLSFILANFILTMFVAILSNIIKGTPFTSRYMHPIFSILSFFLVSIFIKYIHSNLNILIKLLVVLLSLLLLMVSIHYTYKNITSFDIPSISLVNDYHKWKNTNKYYCYIKTYPDNPKNNALNISQAAVYLSSLHKSALVNSKVSSPDNVRTTLFGHDNKILFKKLFNNVKFK